MQNTGHVYTEAEHAFLHEFIPGHSHKEILAAFNEKFDNELTPGSLKHYVSKYKVKTGRTGKFEKGHVSPNTGKKGTYAAGAEKGWFKKGHSAHNRVPVGTEIINTEGYRMVKVRDGKTQNFDFKHKIVWVENNGPIPEGMMITFLDGNKLNCNIDNLKLVSRAEHARLNAEKLRSTNPELTELGINIARIEQQYFEKRGRRKK